MHTTTIVGRVGSDPKPLGQVGCYFSIATDRYNGSTKQQETTWSRVKAFGKTAETCQKYVTKGRLIGVICHYEVSKYTPQGGVEREDHSFVIDNLELMPNGKGHQQNAPDPNVPDANPVW